MKPDDSCPTANPCYDDRVLDHYEDPYHRGRCPGCTHAHQERNMPCGETLRMELRIDADGVVRAVYFSGDGCCISQAAASMLAQRFENKHVEQVRNFGEQEMLELFGVPLTTEQRQCCLLPWRVLRHAVDSPVDGRRRQ